MIKRKRTTWLGKIRAIVAMAIGISVSVVPGAFAQIAQVQAPVTAANNLATASQAATYGTPPTQGNLLIAVCGVQGTAAISISEAGWTAAINQQGTASAPGQAIFYKIAGASEGSTVTCTTTGNQAVGIHIHEYSGVDQSAPLDQTASSTGSSTMMVTGTTAATDTADELLFGAITCAEDTAFNNSWNNSFTELVDFPNTAGSANERHMFGGADQIVSTTGTYSTGSTNTETCNWRGQIATFRQEVQVPINVSGTSNSTGTVALAYNSTLQSGDTGTISGGTWNIVTTKTPAPDTVITVWIDGAADADQSTAVTKYDGSGNINGMVLDRHVLSIGSTSDKTSLSITDLGLYDNTGGDDDIMHFSDSGTLTVDADAAYGNESMNIIFGGSLTIAGNEAINTGTMDIDGTLGVTGTAAINVSGDWLNSGTFIAGTSTVTFTGTLAGNSADIDSTGSADFDLYNVVFDDGAAEATFVLESSLNISGTMTITDGTVDVNASENNGVFITGDFINSDTFMAQTGTVTFEGTQDQTITSGGNAFHNIVINNTGAGGDDEIILQDPLDIDGTLTITTGTLDVNSASNHAVTIAGNWINTGSFLAQTGTVTFDATSGAPTITRGASPFYNVVFNDSDSNITFTLQDSLDVDGTLKIAGGSLDVGSGTNHAIMVASHWINNDTFLEQTGTVTFDGTVDQLVTSGGNVFHNIVINNTGAGGDDEIILQDPLDIDGTLTITTGTLDVNSASNHAITIAGNWINTGSFLAQTGTVTFDATSGAPTITRGASPFYNVVFNDSDSNITFALQDSLDVDGTLKIAGGSLDVGSGTNHAIIVASHWINNDTFLAQTGTVTFDATSGAPMITRGASPFYNVGINDGGSGIAFTLMDPLDVDGTMTITAGTLDVASGGNHAVTVAGSWLNTGSLLAQTGTITFDGTADQALSSGGEPFYNLVINNTGSAGNDDIVLNGTLDVDGTLRLVDGNLNASVNNAAINAAGNWVTGTLGSFAAGSKGTVFKAPSGIKTILNTGQTYGSIEFNSASPSTATWVVSGTMDIDGTFLLTSGTVDFATNEPNTFISGNVLVNGGTIVPNVTGTITLDGDLTFTDNVGLNWGNVEIGTSPDTTDLMSDFSGANLTVNAGDRLNSNGYDIDLSKTFTINGTFDATDDVETDETFIMINNDFIANAGAALIMDQSTIIFDDVAGTSNLITDSGTFEIYNLTVQDGNGGGQLNVEVEDPLHVNGTINIDDGTLDVVSGESNAIVIGGNWIINSAGNGAFMAQTGTVTFDGATPSAEGQSITGSTTFYNFEKRDTLNDGISGTLTFDNTATQTISGTLTLEGIDSDDRVVVQSDSGGVRFDFSVSADQTTNWLNVIDSEVFGTANIRANNSIHTNTDSAEPEPHWIFGPKRGAVIIVD